MISVLFMHPPRNRCWKKSGETLFIATAKRPCQGRATSPAGGTNSGPRAVSAARGVSLMGDDCRRALVVRGGRNGPDLVVAGLARLGLALERELEHLVDPLHRHDLEPVLDVVG